MSMSSTVHSLQIPSSKALGHSQVGMIPSQFASSGLVFRGYIRTVRFLVSYLQGWGSSSNFNQYPVHPVLGGRGPAGPVQYPILRSKRSPVQFLVTGPYSEIYTSRLIKKMGSLLVNAFRFKGKWQISKPATLVT